MLCNLRKSIWLDFRNAELFAVCPSLLLHPISFSAAFFNLSLWLIEIEINMLDEKLIKFLALQRIHQLFPSRVQTSPGSVGAHPLASGGHHTEGVHTHLPPHHAVRSLCGNGHLPSWRSQLSILRSCFFSQKIGIRWHPQLQLRLQEVRCNFLSYVSTLRHRKQLQVLFDIM